MKSLHVPILTDLKQIDRDCRSELEKQAYIADVATYWGIDTSTVDLQTLKDLQHVFVGDDEQTVLATSASYALQAVCITSFLSDLKTYLNNNNIIQEIAAVQKAIADNDNEGRQLCEMTALGHAHAFTDEAFEEYYSVLNITDADFKAVTRRLFHHVGMVSFLNMDTVIPDKFGEMVWFIAEHHADIKKLKLIV